jgi:hypothetical protein
MVGGPATNVKLRDPANAELTESLLGETGYGMPVRLTSYTLNGRGTGLLKHLYDVNWHPEANDPLDQEISQENVPFEEFTPGFWERLIERWDRHADEKVDWYYVNTWYPNKRVCVEVYRDKEGTKYLHVPKRRGVYYRWALIIRSDAVRMRVTNLKAEEKARANLLEKLSGRQKRELILTGAFTEVGRSGMNYRITFNRPTLAYRIVGCEGRQKELEFRAALCLHPLGFYSKTFTGSLPPSEDMLTHLLMIRADEHGFWKKSNQHTWDDPLGGL